MRTKIFIAFCLILSFFCLSSQAQNQSTQTFFGKSRIQYKTFNWSFFRTTNFDIYYYQEGRELAQFTAQEVNKIKNEIEQYMNYRLDGRYQFIVYRKLSDLQQTNLGVDLEQYNTGGLTKMVGNKVLLHFNGDWYDYKKQIRAGIAKVLLFDMLYGGSIQEKIQNSTLIYLPQWYINGFLAYIEDYWNTTDDNRLKDYLQNFKIKKFNHLLGKDPVLAGKSLWFYIDQAYGAANVSSIIYLTRINRDYEQALVYVLGRSLKNISPDWLSYYKQQYSPANNNDSTQFKLRKFRKGTTLTQIKYNPKSKDLAYVSHRNGINRIWTYNRDEGKHIKLHKSGLKYLTLFNKDMYPVICWHPSGDRLAFFYDKKGDIYFGTIDLREDQPVVEEELLPKIDDLLTASYNSDGTKLLLTATRKGQSDIYEYSVRARRLVPITQDRYDELEAIYLDDRLLVVSNRPEGHINQKYDSTRVNPKHDLFSFNLKKGITYNLTSDDLAIEKIPLRLDSNQALILSDKSGRSLRYKLELDSTLKNRFVMFNMIDSSIRTVEIFKDTARSRLISNPDKALRWHDLNPRYKLIIDEETHKGKSILYERKYVNIEEKPEAPKTSLRTLKEEIYKSIIQRKSYENKKVIEETEIDIDNYFFQVETDLEPLDNESGGVDFSVNKISDIERLERTKASLYRTAFSTDYLISQFGNSLVQNNIPTFIISSINSLTQKPGFILMGGASDLFEDYKFSGGLRISTDPNNEAFLMYEDLKSRWDKKYVFHQQRFRVPIENQEQRFTYTELMSSFKYPFNPHANIQFNQIYRRDRIEVMSTDQLRLETEGISRNWLGSRIEFVFDNTRNKQLNILFGTRYKFFVEAYYQFEEKKKYMGILGADVRNYQPIYRNLIWANRFAFNGSVGPQRILYYLGGVDGWLIPKFDDGLAISEDTDYAFEAIGTNMRGFALNARNGSNYAVFNSELRWPIFSFLSRSPLSSDFLRNFQIVGFADVGSAWSGFNPFSVDNPFNIAYYRIGDNQGRDKVRVKVITNKNPVLLGYGGGLRTRLFGYFIRADLAWGVDDQQILDPVFYLSLSLDF